MTHVNILVDEGSLGRIQSVIAELRKLGLRVSHVEDELGLVSGSIEKERLASVAHVRGVSAVEEDRSVQIAPPRSVLQ